MWTCRNALIGLFLGNSSCIISTMWGTEILPIPSKLCSTLLSQRKSPCLHTDVHMIIMIIALLLPEYHLVIKVYCRDYSGETLMMGNGYILAVRQLLNYSKKKKKITCAITQSCGQSALLPHHKLTAIGVCLETNLLRQSQPLLFSLHE